MTTRIKYDSLCGFLVSNNVNIYGKMVIVSISNSTPHKIKISTALRVVEFKQKSIQQAKRKIRKMLREEFEVNLGDEVRSKACF